MTDSILDSTKKVLGLAKDYDAFDEDVLMHINSTFFNLQQLGVGPVGGFIIEGRDETWESFEVDMTLYSAIKSYVYLSVRLLFDPPATSFGITAMEKQKEEFEWRLNVQREATEWQEPVFVPKEMPTVIDGGGA